MPVLSIERRLLSTGHRVLFSFVMLTAVPSSRRLHILNIVQGSERSCIANGNDRCIREITIICKRSGISLQFPRPDERDSIRSDLRIHEPSNVNDVTACPLQWAPSDGTAVF